jgi:acyl-CoA thioesterase
MEGHPTKYHKQFEKDLFAKTSGIKLVEASPGYAKSIMEIKQNHLNSVGVVHGGAMFTLADFTFAVASNAHGKLALAIDAEISFFKSVSSGTLIAIAKEISLHTKIGTYLIDIFDDKEVLVANFKGTVYRKSETLDFD